LYAIQTVRRSNDAEGDSIMADKERLEKLEKLEDIVVSYWDTLDDTMKDEIREVLDDDE
jgi:hypothetical protein